MSSITIEKYAYFKPEDIAAMSVDVALTILEKDPGFDKRRELRDMVNAKYYNFAEIAEMINKMGKDLVPILADK